MATFGIDAGTVEEVLEQLGRLMGHTFQVIAISAEGDVATPIQINYKIPCKIYIGNPG